MKKSDFKGLFIWGTGVNAEKLNLAYENELKKEKIIGYIDNDLKKIGKSFWGKKIYAPDILKDFKDSVIFISVSKKEEIYRQICREYPLYKEKILEENYFIKKKLVARYERNENDEIREILKYLKDNPLDIFNYSFVKKYKTDEIFIGKEKGLHYTIHNGKKLFFSKKYDTEEKARKYYLSLIIEQDIDSPHRYLTESFQVPEGAVVIDAGTAEGIFSLDIIDRAKIIYMFEPDKNWVDALKYTFEMYMDKIVIINKCLSNYINDDTTTLDDSVKENKVDFIKMDIEGEEYYALQGAEKLLNKSSNIKCDICTYHQEFAYEVIKDKLEELGFSIIHSKGYMWYIEHFNIMRSPVLRRGLIRAEKNTVIIDNELIDIYENKLKDFCFVDNESWAIYGTGRGAEIVFQIFKEWKKERIIKAVIDNDMISQGEIYFHNNKVVNLCAACKYIDGIIIASMDYHKIVYERVQSFVDKHYKGKIKIINIFGYNTNDEIREYVNYIENYTNRKDKNLYEDCDIEPIKLQKNDTKVIAWYLPQFHRIDINDIYYGRGFTEWTNTSKMIPMFTGHYQPHIPYDVGYYDLNNSEVFFRQIELAKHYGIYGFSFYYYWFSGKRIMEKPLEHFLQHPELDIKYCITWANENWTALWDGGNNDLIFEQKLQNGDAERFIEDLLPFFNDSRYIRINNKLLLIVYRPTVWEKDCVKKLFQRFRDVMRKKNMNDLYIMVCNARGFDESVEDWGADALVEFPPHGIGQWTPVIRVNGYLNPYFVGHIRSTEEFIREKKYLYEHKCGKYFRSAMPSWDNTPRKANNGATIYTGLSPSTFQQWMKDIILESKKIHSGEEDIVFVNAWNEWAEGTHLEPDMKYGYANLKAIKKAIEQSR